MTDMEGIPGPGLEEYVAGRSRRQANPVLIEVGIRTTDHPDGTGYAWPEGSDELYDALGDLIATAESWRTALRRRPPNTTEEEIDPA